MIFSVKTHNINSFDGKTNSSNKTAYTTHSCNLAYITQFQV